MMIRKLLMMVVLLASGLAAQSTYRINAGGAEFTDAYSQVWAADTQCVTSGGTVYSASSSTIEDTDDDTLYATGCTGTAFSYTFVASPGIWRITLKFAEPTSVYVGRVFNVKADGKSLLTNLDVYGRVGAGLTAYDRAFDIPVTGTSITVNFSQVSLAAIVSALEVRYVSVLSNGTTLPSTCDVGYFFYKTDTTTQYICSATNTWSAVTGGTGMPEPSSNGVVVRTSAGNSAARTITGTANEVAVTNGDGVAGNPTLALAADVDLSSKTTTKPMKAGTSAPATCAVGELFYDTDATAGQNVYGCTAADTWTLQGGGGSGAPTDAQYLALAVDGDLSAERVFTPRDNLVATDAGANGNYTVDFNPFDRSVFWLVDDFFGGLTTTGNVGDLGWNPVYGGTPTINAPGGAGDANHLSVLELTSGAVADNAVEIYWGGSATAKNWVAWNSHPWELQWIFKTGPSVTSVHYSTGLGVYPTDGFSGSEGIRLRYSTAASDTAWIAARAQGVSNWTTVCTASEAPLADTWYRTQWVCDGSTIAIHLYKAGGATDLFTDCTTSTYSTTIGVAPYIGVATAEAVAKSIYIDWFAFKMRGLTR